jgi:NitT/TauT family transport system permease protein
MRLHSKNLASLGWATLGTASLLIGWHLVVASGLVHRDSMPGPLDVAQAFPTLFSDADFRSGALDTVTNWISTVVIGSVAAVAVGLAAASTPALLKPTELVVNTFRAVPATALIPIAVIMFGLGSQMKMSVAVYAIFWPIVINTMYGVAMTEPMRLDAARSMHWKWWRRQAFVTLPTATPSILTGIRISVGIALVVIISTELLGARYGVGTVLVQYTQAERPDVVYAGVLVLGVVGAAAFSLMMRAQRRLVRWA